MTQQQPTRSPGCELDYAARDDIALWIAALPCRVPSG